MATWNAYTERRLSHLTRRLKRRRVELFVRACKLAAHHLVLDLGSEDGSYLAAFYPHPSKIVLADVVEEPLRRGVKRHGLRGYRLIQEDGRLPFEDGEFDAVWCNSVIEHVTLSRTRLPTTGNAEFATLADDHQRRFAREIARVGKRYFVQTPYRHCPIEAHSWLPLVQYLPQQQRWRLSRTLKPVWIKQWSADFHLYDLPRFRDHYFDATTIEVERVLGVPKALIAVRSP